MQLQVYLEAAGSGVRIQQPGGLDCCLPVFVTHTVLSGRQTFTALEG